MKKQVKYMVTSTERKHYDKVAALGCCLCNYLHGEHDPGLVELHHLRAGGWGRGDYKTVMGLCYEHHRGNTGVHGLGTKQFEKYYKISQNDLLNWVLSHII